MHVTKSILSSCKRLIPAVYGISKQGVHVQSDLQLERSPTGAIQVGEDAAFFSVGLSSSYHLCGVADGVGGWTERGIDPSFFSKSLLESCCRIAERQTVDLHDPVKVLIRALKEVTWFHPKCYGSSTACILSMDCMSGVLHTCNLGDSGFLVVRGDSIVEESEPLMHYFNCPYQISRPPPGFTSSQPDSPKSSHTASVQLEVGDVVLVATDGLFHNMNSKDIIDLIQEFQVTDASDLDKMVKSLVSKAHDLSLDDSFMSPFAVAGSRALSWEFQGGKRDDITILAAAVQGSSHSELPPRKPSR